MQARGPLMTEHRLIEKMIAKIQLLLHSDSDGRLVDPYLIDTIADFICTYADRTHHGKEEGILFRHLEDKELYDEDRRLMNELIADHVRSRELTAALMSANERYRLGQTGALPEIRTNLQALAELYPPHIEKEDKIFFPASRSYLSGEEEEAMLLEFESYDREMIHRKYRELVDELEGK